MTCTPETMKKKTFKFDYIRIKNLCVVENTVRSKEHANWKKSARVLDCQWWGCV